MLPFFIGCGQQGDAKPYPLDYCLVGGSDLGDMGEPVSYIHNGQEFKFCCKPCIPKFKKNPEKYIQELKEEIEDGASFDLIAEMQYSGFSYGNNFTFNKQIEKNSSKYYEGYFNNANSGNLISLG